MIEKFFNKLLGKRPTKVLFESMGNFSLIKEGNMKTIKIIDLLIKNANGEEMPKEIIFENYRYHKHPEGYFRSVINSNWIALTTDFNIYDILNDEVEILEEEKQETKPITKKDFEALGYACGEIQKAFTNGWTKSLENKPLEDEKKIPERLKIEQDISSSNFYIKNEFGTQCYLTKHSKILADKINEILDYLESKGE